MKCITIWKILQNAAGITEKEMEKKLRAEERLIEICYYLLHSI